ncbi:hypothetical protein BH11GEM2_BH11GEM2_38160 [soil metagenome]
MFVLEYLLDLNATQAAVRAGYSKMSARQAGTRLMTNASIRAHVDRELANRAARLQVSADDVVRHWLTIGLADVNELVEYQRACCRYCYGVGNRYQRTPMEMERARKEYDRSVAAQKETKGTVILEPFDEQGGVGYDPRAVPNDECPECHGDGDGRLLFKDTRDLSPVGRLLYAGAERTKDGFKMNTRNQDKAIENVAKHLGMLTPKRPGDDDDPDMTIEERKQRVIEIVKEASARRKQA